MPTQSPHVYTTAALAAEFGCSKQKIRETATQLGVGINIGGRTGFRFDDADKATILASLQIGQAA